MQLLIEEAGIQVHPAQVLTGVLCSQPRLPPPRSPPPWALDSQHAEVPSVPSSRGSHDSWLLHKWYLPPASVRDSSLPVHIVLVLQNAARGPALTVPVGPMYLGIRSIGRSCRCRLGSAISLCAWEHPRARGGFSHRDISWHIVVAHPAFAESVN